MPEEECKGSKEEKKQAPKKRIIDENPADKGNIEDFETFELK